MKHTGQHKDISGQKFGRLTALYRLHNTKGRTKWLCVCECGNFAEVNVYHLTGGHTRSCGCLIKEINITHGKSKIRLYRIWRHIINRCYNINVESYKDYGARGIIMCDEWRNDFQAFYDWSMDNGYDDSLTIDRVDVNGNYEPNNCRWVTKSQQSKNKRNCIYYTINGEARCLSDCCKILNLNYNTVTHRVQHGWSVGRALELE